MTTYLGEKAVGIGTIKATKAVAGDVLHDETLVGNGNTEPLGVNKQVIATTNQVGNLATTLHAAIEAQAEEIAKTRENSVKKSGDTMTGDLVFDAVSSADIIFQDSSVDTAGNTNSVRKFISAPHQTQGFIFSEIKNGVNKMQFSMVNDGLIMPFGNRLLGSSRYSWENVYAKKLNNGADIAIPTLGGTLARIEDLTKLDSEKIDKNQGTINAGKYLMVGDDGIVGLTDSGGGGGIANVIHDSTLSGKGTDDEPLGVNTEVIATKEDLESKADKDDIPTKTSQLENDSGFLTEHQDISGKQDKLTAGANISIVDNTISSTAQESFFRGRWDNWEEVPNDANSYPEDFNGNRTPTTNDYMVVVDASQYTPGMTESIIISKEPSSHILVINGVNVGKPNQTDTYTFDTVTYTVESTNGGGSIKVFANKNVQYNGQLKIVGTPVILTAYASTIESSKIYYSKLDNLSGTWRFGYKGIWADDNESGWKPEYQIEETLPIATETQAGIAKLYKTSGSNSDGAMTQSAVGAAINTHNVSTNAHSNIRGVAGGLATLDNNAKVPMSQINDSLLGNVSYQGLWNATENVPFLADPSGDLPLGYTQLQAIQGSGGAYIDTGVVFTGQKIKYVMDWSGGAGTYEKLYGACTTLENYTSSDSTGCIFFGGKRNEVRVNVGKIQVTPGIMASGKMSTELIVDSQAKFYEFIINDNRYTGTFTGDVNRELPIHLCRQNYQTANASAPKPFAGNVYSFSLEMDGVIVRNMLPARRDSDGTVGMYDTINDVFYGPADGGVFIAVEGDIQLPKGDYYITSVAGDRFGLHFDVGDWVISTGEGWTKVDNTDAVVTVNGRTGNVVLGANDVGAYTKEEVDALVGSGGGSMPTRYVESINGFTGNVFLGCREIGTYTTDEIDEKIDETVADFDELSARVDTYSDTEFIARQVIASDRYIDLTLGTSGASYTAPADGWLVLNKLSSGTSYQFVQLYNTKNADRRIGAATTNNAYLCATMPLAKGDMVLVEYSATGATKVFRFIYANGAK